MLPTIRNITCLLGLLVTCVVLMGTTNAAQRLQSQQLSANDTFQKRHEFTIGKNVPFDTYALPILNSPKRTGLFNTTDRTKGYVTIDTARSTMPNNLGLRFDQIIDINHPVQNRFIISGTPTAAPGDYPLTLIAKDEETNQWSNALYLTIHITGTLPRPPYADPTHFEIQTTEGDSANNISTSNYFHPGSSSIDSYRVNILPPGISFNIVNGTFNGTYTQKGTYVTQVEAHNGAGWSSQKLTVTFTIAEHSMSPPYPTGKAPDQAGLVGESKTLDMSPYFSVDKFSPPMDGEYRIAPDSDDPLPPGLNLNGSVVSGTFSADSLRSEPYRVSIQAHNSKDWSASQIVTFAVNDVPFADPSHYEISAQTEDKINESITNYFKVNPGAATDINSYRVDTLPPGIGFDSDKGIFSGTYTTKGTYTTLVEARNSAGWSTKKLTVTFAIAEKDKGLPPSTKDFIPVQAGLVEEIKTLDIAPYFQVDDKSPPITEYRVAPHSKDQLPAGLSLKGSIISGKLEQPSLRIDPYYVSVQAYNSKGWSAEQVATYNISELPYLDPDHLEIQAQEGDPTDKNISSYFHTHPNVKSVHYYRVDTLPPGVGFDPLKGTFNGTYTKKGTYTTLVEAENAAGWCKNKLKVTFTITGKTDFPYPDPLSYAVTGYSGDENVKEDISKFFHTTEGAGSITGYRVDTLPPGIKFDNTSGVFSGKYEEKGVFISHVEAENSAGWSPQKLIVTFTIAEHDMSPPYPTGKVPDQAGLVGESKTLDMSPYFSVDKFSPPMDGEYQIAPDSDDQLPPGLNLSGSVISGTFSEDSLRLEPYRVSIQAHNDKGWSASQIVTFTVNDIPFADPSHYEISAQTEDKINENISNYFKVNPGATTDINTYRIDLLPPGIIFNLDKGIFSGTYTTKGTYTSLIEARNSAGWSEKKLTVTFTITKKDKSHPPYPVDFIPIQVGLVDDIKILGIASYFKVDDSSPPINEYRVAPTSKDQLPAGLSLNGSIISGKLEKTSLRMDPYYISLQARNDKGWSTEQIATYYISDLPYLDPDHLEIQAQEGDPADKSISSYFHTHPKAKPVHYYRVDTLPPGVGFDPLKGTFNGTYTKKDTYTTLVEAENAAGWCKNKLKVTFTITEKNAGRPPYPCGDDIAKQTGHVGETKELEISPYFCTDEYSPKTDKFQISPDADQLPDGLSLNGSKISGVLSDKSPRTKDYNVNVQAHNDKGWSSSKAVIYVITDFPYPDPSSYAVTGSLDEKDVKVDISKFFHTTEGAGNITAYRVDTLPSGIKFDNTSGVFSGKYEQTGVFTSHVEAENSAGWSPQKLTVTFSISDKQPTIVTVTCPDLDKLVSENQNKLPDEAPSKSAPDFKFKKDKAPVQIVRPIRFAGSALRPTNHPNGLSCSYNSIFDRSPTISYVYDPVPEGMYFGDDPTKTKEVCKLPQDECKFNFKK